MAKKKKKKIDLKKELKKKERELEKAKEEAQKKLEKASEEIMKNKETKLENVDKRIRKKIKELDKKEKGIIKELEEKAEKIEKEFEKKIKKALKRREKKHKSITKEAEKQRVEAEKEAMRHIDESRKEYVSLKKRVYSGRRKILNTLQFIGVLYLFILSVTLLKDVAFELSNGVVYQINQAVSNPTNAFGAGWLTAILAQSASVIAIIANSLVGSGVINFKIGFYILLGLTLGNAITPVVASLILKAKSHWDLRHGFELGLANVVYSFFLVIMIIIVEVITGFFTASGESIALWAETFPAIRSIPSILDVVTDPVIEIFFIESWPIIITFITSVLLLVFSLQRVGRSMFIFMGGRRHTRAIIEKFLKTHWRGFFIGLGLTIIIPSASLLVTLLVPLAITRIVTLRQAIPYMIGASVGTFIDVLLASFANGEPYSIAGGIVLTMLSAFGVIFIIRGWGANIVYKITRYLSLHIISMKKRNILYFIIGFTIIPLIIVAIFR